MAKTDTEDSMAKFEALMSRVGKDLRGIWDVYITSDHKALLYHPIIFMKYEKVLAERERLARLSIHKLVAVKVVYEEILSRNPAKPRRSGCFRKIKWLAPDFSIITKPRVIEETERSLEKESRWLSGGPRPDLNKITT